MREHRSFYHHHTREEAIESVINSTNSFRQYRARVELGDALAAENGISAHYLRKTRKMNDYELRGELVRLTNSGVRRDLIKFVSALVEFSKGNS